MTVKVDASEFSAVVWCTDCSDWSASAFDADEGHSIAVDHENSVHPHSRVAEINRFKWVQRRDHQTAS